MAANVWTILLTLGTLPVLLHGLGVEAFGVWVFLQTFGATNGWLSVPGNGLSVAATRTVAGAASTPRSDELRRSVSATITSFAIAGIAFGLTMTVVAPILTQAALDLRDVNTATLRVVAVAFGIQTLAEFMCLAITSVLEGLQEVAVARGVDSLRKTAVAVATSVAALSGGGLRWVGVASAASAVGVTAIAGLYLHRSRRPGFRDLGASS